MTLTIPKPCSENWNNFVPAKNGGFCSSCNETVVDFSKMADAEILDFFNSKPTHTCGRFRPEQLKAYVYAAPAKFNPGLTLLKAGFLSLLFIIVSKQSFAQTTPAKTQTEVVPQQRNLAEKNNTIPMQIIKGVVKSAEDQLPLAGTSIYLKDSSEGTTADENGNFEFPQKLSAGDVLVFSFIGFETQEYVVPKKVDGMIEIPMLVSDVVMMGAVAVTEVYTTHQSGFRAWLQKVKSVF